MGSGSVWAIRAQELHPAGAPSFIGAPKLVHTSLIEFVLRVSRRVPQAQRVLQLDYLGHQTKRLGPHEGFRQASFPLASLLCCFQAKLDIADYIPH